MRALIDAVVILSLVATRTAAQKENVTERYAVEFDGGFLTDYDDSEMWDHGYDAGVTGMWALSASTTVCARFGISHWAYTSPTWVVDDLVPDDALLLGEQSTGQLEILALTPMVRYQREEVLRKLGAFVEGGIGPAYVKTFALTEVSYVDVVGHQVDKFEINETDIRANVMLGAGFSYPLSTSSWIDVWPAYRAVFADETAHLLCVSVGFRVRV